MTDEQFYNKMWKTAYINAFTITKNTTDAEDIAQIATIKFYIKKASVENPLSWIAVVAKNEALKMVKNANKSISLKDENLADNKIETATLTILNFWDKDDDELSEDLTITIDKVKELLSKNDYKLFNRWKRSDFDSVKMAHRNNLSNKQANNAIYKIKRNLRAAMLLNADYRATKIIVNYQLNKRII